MKCTVSRYINGITLNPKEFVTDFGGRMIIFNSVMKAKLFLNKHKVKKFDGLYFEKPIKKESDAME